MDITTQSDKCSSGRQQYKVDIVGPLHSPVNVMSAYQIHITNS